MTTEHGDHHDDHDHGEFIAHHFESAEQQFDSGKLGIWVFLLTEILFFSGLFCAYVLYRYLNPEIFVQASQYLDKVLGGGNTIVLLFSSLTMALAVRASQLGKNRTVAVMVLVTMVCATIFLGVKAVEYSHKWDMGIFTRAYFHLDESHHASGISIYLQIISIVPAILLAVFGAVALLFKVTGKSMLAAFYGGMTIMVLGYFIGAAGGYVYQNSIADSSHAETPTSPESGNLTAVSHHLLFQDEVQDESGDSKQETDDQSADETVESETKGEQDHGDDENSETATGDAEHNDKTDDEHGDDEHGDHSSDSHAQEKLNHDIGIFFSIYYCMTGLHAFHVIGGIIALAWIFYRSLLGHWRSDYFGPVDYVGLYWHLVDLIWIFLFPLLYLIN